MPNSRSKLESVMEPLKRFPAGRASTRLRFVLRRVFAGLLLVAGPAFADITDKETAKPFAAINVTNADPVTVSIIFPDVRGTFPTGAGFTKSVLSGTATYSLTPRSPASAQTFLRGLDFTPTENRIPLGTTETTTFTVRGTDANGSTDIGFPLTVSP